MYKHSNFIFFTPEMERAKSNLCIIMPDDDSDKDDSDDKPASVPSSPDTPPAVPPRPPRPRRLDTEQTTPTSQQKSSSADTETAADDKTREDPCYSEIEYVPIQPSSSQNFQSKEDVVGTEDRKDENREQPLDASSEEQFPCVKTLECKDPGLPHLLKMRNFGKDFKGCRLEIDEGKCQLKILAQDEGTALAVQLQYYEFANSVFSYKVEISNRMSDRLNSPHGKTYLESKQHGKKGVFVYVNDIADCHYLCGIGLSEATVRDTVTYVMSGLKESKLPFTDGHITVFGLPDWKKLQSKLETEYHVNVEVSSTNSEIVIEGLTDDVDRSSHEIQGLLKKHEELRPVVLRGGQARCFLHSKNMKQQLEILKKQLRYLLIYLNLIFSEIFHTFLKLKNLLYR